MNRRRPDEAQRQARIDRRLTARETARAKVQQLRDWHASRAAAAEERAEAKRAADKEKIDQAARGVGRVPAHLQGLNGTQGLHLAGKRHPKVALAHPDDLHPSGNYATRRARGHRGHTERTRLRDMPGAVERRLERARLAWAAEIVEATGFGVDTSPMLLEEEPTLQQMRMHRHVHVNGVCRKNTYGPRCCSCGDPGATSLNPAEVVVHSPKVCTIERVA